MKAKYVTIVLALGLLIVIGGAFLLTSQGQAPLAATIKFDPNFVEWDGTTPSVWRVWIQSADGSFNPRYVDGSSVLFESTVPAIGGHYETGKWIAEFNGQAIWNILSSTIGHMGVPPDISTKTPVHYYFTVSGTIVGAKGIPDGTPFEGEGWIAVRFIHGLPSPPPPTP
jgi:hypothetical protein